MKVDQDVWSKWQGWVKTIENDLATVVEDQALFDKFREIVQQNGAWIDSLEGGAFVDLVRRSYASAAFMGIRRQVKTDDQSASFVRLLKELSAQASQITYEFYLRVLPLNSDL